MHKIRFALFLLGILTYMLFVLIIIKPERQEIHLSGSDILYPEPDTGKLYLTLHPGLYNVTINYAYPRLGLIDATDWITDSHVANNEETPTDYKQKSAYEQNSMLLQYVRDNDDLVSVDDKSIYIYIESETDGPVLSETISLYNNTNVAKGQFLRKRLIQGAATAKPLKMP